MMGRFSRKYGYELFLFAFLLVWVAVIGSMNGSYLSIDNFVTVITRMNPEVIMAVGMTLVVIIGGFDLSIGAIMALVPLLMGMLYGAGVPFWAAVLSGMLAGCAVGVLNGLLVYKAKMQPIIATLATMTVVRSVVYGMTQGRPVTTFPSHFNRLDTARLIGIPIPVWITAIIVAAGIFVLHRTKMGRFIFALGGNEKAAFVSGVQVNKLKVMIYVISALLAGFAGILFASRVNIASPDAGLTIAFDVITAVLLGGTSILGGQGSIFRSVIGVFIMNTIINGFNLVGINTYWQTIFMGCVLIGVVGLDMKRKQGSIDIFKIFRKNKKGVMGQNGSS